MLYKFGPEGGRIRLVAGLGALLAAAMAARGIGLCADLVVPVPSHRHRVGERGFDAASALAQGLARRLGLPRPCRLLARRTHDAPRARRRPGAPARTPFRLRLGARRRLGGRRVLLVDDVVTTGATIRSCAGLLADAGAAEVRVAVLAITPLRHESGGGGTL